MHAKEPRLEGKENVHDSEVEGSDLIASGEKPSSYVCGVGMQLYVEALKKVPRQQK